MSRQFQHSFEVCTCKHVSLGEIIHAIKERGAKDLNDIKEFTDAGSSCGCCKSKDDDFTGKQELFIEEIIDKFVK